MICLSWYGYTVRLYKALFCCTSDLYNRQGGLYNLAELLLLASEGTITDEVSLSVILSYWGSAFSKAVFLACRVPVEA